MVEGRDAAVEEGQFNRIGSRHDADDGMRGEWIGCACLLKLCSCFGIYFTW